MRICEDFTAQLNRVKMERTLLHCLHLHTSHIFLNFVNEIKKMYFRQPSCQRVDYPVSFRLFASNKHTFVCPTMDADILLIRIPILVHMYEYMHLRCSNFCAWSYLRCCSPHSVVFQLLSI